MSDNMTLIGTSPADRWAYEYNRGGIPSSVRARPSNVVVDFLATVRRLSPNAERALDIGTGTGRNAAYLAEEGFSVDAMDYSAPQIDALRAFAASRPELRLRPVVADVTKSWAFADSSFDIAVDAFCFKHQIESEAIATYIAELRRCLTRGGLYMLFLATRDDGYYRRFPTDEQYGVGQVIVDVGNGIASRLYDRKEIEGLFSGFEAIHYTEKKGTNKMHGRIYERSSAIWHMRRL